MVPRSSWIRILVRFGSREAGGLGGSCSSFCDDEGREGEEDGRAELSVPEERSGGYSANMALATVAWLRRMDAGRAEELERSLPVGVMRMRVWSCGVRLALRKVVRGLVKSMVDPLVGLHCSEVSSSARTTKSRPYLRQHPSKAGKATAMRRSLLAWTGTIRLQYSVC